jgi:hypothetical protein
MTMAEGRWFTLSTPVSSTNKTDRHDIAEIYCVFFSYVSKRKVRHGYMGGGGRVFFANYTLILGFVLTTSVVISTDCTGSCKSNYHTIMTMADPKWTFIFFKGLNITSTWQLLSQFDKFWYNVFERVNKSRWWRGVLDTTLCDKVCQWPATDQWFSLGTPVSSTNKTDCHDIAEICWVFSFVSNKEVTHGYMGGGGHVFFANYILILSYIFIKKKSYIPI